MTMIIMSSSTTTSSGDDTIITNDNNNDNHDDESVLHQNDKEEESSSSSSSTTTTTTITTTSSSQEEELDETTTTCNAPPDVDISEYGTNHGSEGRTRNAGGACVAAAAASASDDSATTSSSTTADDDDNKGRQLQQTSSSTTTSSTSSRILFGSCSSQHHDQPLWSNIISRNAAAFVWCGDAIYADDRRKNKLSREELEEVGHTTSNNGNVISRIGNAIVKSILTEPAKHTVVDATPNYLRQLYYEQKQEPNYKELMNTGISIIGTIDDVSNTQ